MSEDNVCSICQENEPKYTCPACGMKTCSLNCVKRHKNQTECTGAVDQSKFISHKELSENEIHINRDYNFLLNFGRNIQLGKTDIKTNAKNAFKRQYNGTNNNRFTKRFKAKDQPQEAEDSRLAAVAKAFPHAPPTNIKRNNTLIVQLPVGMSRATSNKSGYDKKSSTFTWTIEWVLVDTDGREQKSVISYRLKETLILRDAIPMNITNSTFATDKPKIATPVNIFNGSLGNNDTDKVAAPMSIANTSDTATDNSKVAMNIADSLVSNTGTDESKITSPVSTANTFTATDKPQTATPVSTANNSGNTATDKSNTAAVSTANSGDAEKPKIDKSQLSFYLDNVVNMNKPARSIIRLNPEEPIATALSNKILLEYPKIYVTLNNSTWSEFVTDEKAAYNLAQESSDDDSDSSDSDSSDSDTDSSDSDSDTEDDKPQESSSKGPVTEPSIGPVESSKGPITEFSAEGLESITQESPSKGPLTESSMDPVTESSNGSVESSKGPITELSSEGLEPVTQSPSLNPVAQDSSSVGIE